MMRQNFRLAARLAATAVLALALAGCQQRLGGLAPWSSGDKESSAAGSIVVGQGDSLYVLSRRYQVPLRDLIEINKLSPPYNIEPGQRLTLPAARQYIVQPGDTLYGVSRMFRVDVSELTRLNNLTPPYALKSGQPLRLPSPSAGYAGGDAPPQVSAAPRSKIERSDVGVAAVPPPAASVAPPSAASAPTATPSFNPAAPSVLYQPGQDPRNARPSAPAAAPASASAPPAPPPASPPASTAPSSVLQQPAVAETPPVAPVLVKPGKKPTPTETAADNKPAETAQAPEPQTEPAKETPKEKDKPREASAGKPASAQQPSQPTQTAAAAPPPRAADAEPPPRATGRFLMPVKGSVISGFGPKSGGQHNDGVNIAAPKGTAVVAADNGVVAYVGNELRGFGNLLLIRHADGWVTAYAHLDHINVERGAEVKRGQKIGAVGQSGGVPSPQLHFEVRKGSQAVDPKDQM